MSTKTLKPPANLSTETRRLWVRLRGEHVLDDGASLALLAQFCEATDRLRQIQDAIAVEGLTVVGSQGQKRAHPLLAAESTARRDLLACARSLRLDLTAEA